MLLAYNIKQKYYGMTNGTMIQYFHWYTPGEGKLWNEVIEKAAYLSSLGITTAWLPPPYKSANGGLSTGYDVYDLFDLGEFDQKGTIPTKYGTREQFLAAIDALHEKNIGVIGDIVLNHKGGGDETETITVVKMDPENRLHPISEPFEIDTYTKFTFPGRAGKYSDFIWDHLCFSGVDYDHRTGETAIYNIQQLWGNDWEEMIDDEKGNYDYLMYNDVEFRNPAVREELTKWGKWFIDTAKLDGVRLDAVKHISPRFYNEWLDRLREETGKGIFAVGEYWAPGFLDLLLKYIDATENKMSLFDSSLHHNLHRASKSGEDYDMRSIFNDSLVVARPDKAVTLVDNHDTQPLQSLEAPVEPWFKPIAYSLILLREQGYPCVFYPDLFGVSYKDYGSDGNEHEIFLDRVDGIEEMLKIRKDNAYGLQRDYFDHANCIGWTREGDDDRKGCAIVLSNGSEGFKAMEMGQRYRNCIFYDALGKRQEEIKADENGWATFLCAPGSVSVWLLKE
jgi:alpha-amylase